MTFDDGDDGDDGDDLKILLLDFSRVLSGWSFWEGLSELGCREGSYIRLKVSGFGAPGATARPVGFGEVNLIFLRSLRSLKLAAETSSRAPSPRFTCVMPRVLAAVAGIPHAGGMAKTIDSNGADEARNATLFCMDGPLDCIFHIP